MLVAVVHPQLVEVDTAGYCLIVFRQQLGTTVGQAGV